MNVDQPNLKDLMNRLGNDNVKIDINSEEDLKKLKELGLLNDVNVTVKLSDLYKISELQRNFRYHITLRIDNITQLSEKKLDEIEKKYNIDKIQISQEFDENVKGRNFSNVISEEYCNIRETYRENIYRKIVKKINKLAKKVRKNTSEEEKFCSIYKMLGLLIEYPYDHYEECEILNTKEYLEYSEDHNLTGCLFDRQGACEGIAKTLKQLLIRVGIDSKQIIGEGNGRPHMWNQVKINGKWYNCDLTYDLIRIVNGKKPKYCLLSDNDFKYHETDTPVKEKCPETFDQDSIKKYFEEHTQLVEQSLFSKFKNAMYNFINNQNRNSKIENKMKKKNIKNEQAINNNRELYIEELNNIKSNNEKNLWIVDESVVNNNNSLLEDFEIIDYSKKNKKKTNEEDIDR